VQGPERPSQWCGRGGTYGPARHRGGGKPASVVGDGWNHDRAYAGVVAEASASAGSRPLDKTTSASEPSGSTNPIVDHQFIYGLAGIALALA
jgi:hypothetical protein